MTLSATIAAAAVATVETSVWYRVTPTNYTNTVTNMDTADVKGDAIFSIFELSFPFWCSDNMAWLNCKNNMLNHLNKNVYESYAVQHSARYGDYNFCNPDPDTGVFHCTPSNSCWNQSHEAPAWHGICDPDECHCDAEQVRAVGRYFAPLGDWPINPLGGPPACDPYWIANHTTAKGTRHALYANATQGDCCERCDEAGAACAAAVYVAANKTCTVYSSAAHNGVPAEGSVLFQPNHFNGTAMWWAKRKNYIANRLNGTWFSTRSEGECGPGQHPVDGGCTWVDLGVQRTINATCAVRNLVGYMKEKQPSCWDECPLPYDAFDECSVKCFYEAAANPAVPVEHIFTGLATSFEFNTTEHYGCPDWKPLQ